MVNYSQKNLNNIFSALSDPTRRKILTKLSYGETNVSELAKPFQMSLPAVTKHIKVLEKAELVNKKRIGRQQKISLNSKTLQQVSCYIKFYEKFWTKKLDNLENFFSKRKGGEIQHE